MDSNVTLKNSAQKKKSTQKKKPQKKNKTLDTLEASLGQDAQKSFHRLKIFINIQTFIIVLLIAALIFYVNNFKKQTYFYAETASGSNMQMQSLPLPNLGRAAMANWVSKAVVQVMTFGFHDLDERFSQSKQYFTPDGWNSFFKAMIKSQLAENVIKNQQIVTAILGGTPVLRQEGLIKSKYSWVFHVPLLVTVRSGGVKQERRKRLNVTIERVSPLVYPNAVGIAAWDLY